MLDAISLCNAALRKLAVEPITSFNDGTDQGDVCRLLYGPTRDRALAEHPWGFARAERLLSRDATATSKEFTYSYALPTDYLTARKILDEDGRSLLGRSYQVIGRRLATDAEAVLLVYTARAGEGVFPAHFQSALIELLAAELTMPLTESTERLQLHSQLAERHMRAARYIDSQQQTPQSITDFPLVAVR